MCGYCAHRCGLHGDAHEVRSSAGTASRKHAIAGTASRKHATKPRARLEGSIDVACKRGFVAKRGARPTLGLACFLRRSHLCHDR